MAFKTFQYIGELDLEHLPEDCYRDISINQQQTELEIRFEADTLQASNVQQLQLALEKLVEIEAENRAKIRQVYERGTNNTIHFYMKHYVDTIAPEVLTTTTDSNQATTIQKQLIAKATLSNIIIYPQEEDYLLQFDYIILPQHNDHILVLIYSPTFKLLEIVIES